MTYEIGQPRANRHVPRQRHRQHHAREREPGSEVNACATVSEPAIKPSAVVSISANNILDLFIELKRLLADRANFSHLLMTEAKIFENFCGA